MSWLKRKSAVPTLADIDERVRALSEMVEARTELARTEAIACSAEHIALALQELEKHITSASQEHEKLRQHLPALLNALATIPALSNKIAALEDDLRAASRDKASSKQS